MNMKQRYAAKQHMKRQAKTGPRTIPTSVTLPGGVVLKAMPFNIVEYNDDGTPRLFELQSADAPHDMEASNACVLFANETWIRSPRPGKAER